MNWDAISAVSEVMAAIGVIISLVFVGLQIKKSNTEARAATSQATTDTELEMVATFAAHVEVWNKVNSGVPLEDEVENRLGIILFNMLMIDYENRLHQYQAGYYDERSWHTRLDILSTLVTLPIFIPWRRSFGGRSRGAQFLDLVDEVARKSGATR